MPKASGLPRFGERSSPQRRIGGCEEKGDREMMIVLMTLAVIVIVGCRARLAARRIDQVMNGSDIDRAR